MVCDVNVCGIWMMYVVVEAIRRRLSRRKRWTTRPSFLFFYDEREREKNIESFVYFWLIWL